MELPPRHTPCLKCPHDSAAHQVAEPRKCNGTTGSEPCDCPGFVAPFDPDWCVHPGQTLAEVLKEASISTAELAERTGRSVEQIENILDGHALYSADLALAMERALPGTIDAEFWLRLRSGWELGLAKGRTPC